MTDLITGFILVPEVQIMTVVIVGYFFWKGLTASSKDNKED
jgi:hypothetical protein